MDPKLRRADVHDTEVLVRHRRAMFTDMGGYASNELDMQDDAYRAWVRERLARDEAIAWLVEHGASAAASGVVWLQPVQPNPKWLPCKQAYLMSMFTEHSARGRGFAQQIVGAALAWASESGYPKLMLHASEMGRPIYEKMGFVRTWEMRKEI